MVNETQLVDRLFEKMLEISLYPVGVVPVRQRIKGTAFFPGGAGLYIKDAHNRLPTFPVRKIMILGHDFDTESRYKISLSRGKEDIRKNPTWRNLLWLLEQVRLSSSDCFFTNFYMGLRANDKPTGRFPGSRNPDFVEQCREFLAYQIEIQKPSLILTLGRYVPPLIAPLSPDLADWRGCRSFSLLDTQAQPMVPVVKFGKTIHIKATVVALTHPSMWHRCVLGRSYGTLRGKDAELRMLKEAIEVSGVLSNQ